MKTHPWTTRARALFVVPFAFASTACATTEYIGGTTSYTSTPEGTPSSGAVAQTAVLCSARESPEPRFIKIGSCELEIPWSSLRANLGKRSSYYRGGQLVALRACVVPGATGPLELEVTSGTMLLTEGTLDVTLGGTSKADGRYITYRFTGPRTDWKAPTEACAWVPSRRSRAVTAAPGEESQQGG